MIMRTATPQETFDHLLGAGGTSYHWWLDEKLTGVAADGTVTEDWTAEMTCESGYDDPPSKTAVISHKTIMKAAREVMAELPQYASKTMQGECAHLVFNADETDFDAGTSDELLQYMVLGEIVFG
jgi:hypothetical protein